MDSIKPLMGKISCGSVVATSPGITDKVTGVTPLHSDGKHKHSACSSESAVRGCIVLLLPHLRLFLSEGPELRRATLTQDLGRYNLSPVENGTTEGYFYMGRYAMFSVLTSPAPLDIWRSFNIEQIRASYVTGYYKWHV